MKGIFTAEEFRSLSKGEPIEKKVPVRRTRKDHEGILQTQCVRWFRMQYPKEIIYAIPNGGKRNRVEAAIMQGQGVTAGVPDLFVAAMRGGYGGMYIEMKYGKNRESDKQVEMRETLSSKGYLCEVCYTFERFMEIVNGYMNIKKH